MSTAIAENKRNITTGHPLLDSELSLISDEELDYLAKYLRLMRELDTNFDDGYSWADAPLTSEEEAQVEQGRRDFEAGEYLTLDEFMKGL